MARSQQQTAWIASLPIYFTPFTILEENNDCSQSIIFHELPPKRNMPNVQSRIIFDFNLVFFKVGLAVGDIDSIQCDANMRRLTMQVEFVTDIDQQNPRFLRKYFHKSVLVLKPNQKNKLAA